MSRQRRLGLYIESPLPYKLRHTVLEDEWKATLMLLGSPPYNPSEEVRQAWRAVVDIELWDQGAIFAGNVL
jgi:hypothetical protein